MYTRSHGKYLLRYEFTNLLSVFVLFSFFFSCAQISEITEMLSSGRRFLFLHVLLVLLRLVLLLLLRMQLFNFVDELECLFMCVAVCSRSVEPMVFLIIVTPFDSLLFDFIFCLDLRCVALYCTFIYFKRTKKNETLV